LSKFFGVSNPQTPASRRDTHHSLLLAKVLSIFSNSDGAVSPTAADRQPQAEAKNAFKNLLLRNFRT
jgi:hypothetical protein